MTEKTGLPRTGTALIGAGMIAQTHVTVLSAARERVRLVSVMSRRPEKAGYLAEFYEESRPLFTSDLSSITENPDIQVAIVATPPSIRIELIESLASAGKNILLQKPVARNVDEAVKVVEIHNARQNRRTLLVSGREGLASHRLIEAIETSSRSGGYVDILH